MPSTRDIRRRIKSVKSTAQITKAMQMVASSKMQKAQQGAINFRPFAAMASEIMDHLAAGTADYRHPLMEEREVRKRVVILISTDKGLCGALNSNLFREVSKYDTTTQFIAVGKKAAQFLARTRRKLVAEFTYHDTPTFGEAQAISKFVQNMFLKGEADAIEVLYTRFINTLSQRPDKRTLLPMGSAEHLRTVVRNHAQAAPPPAEHQRIDFLFEPDPETVMDRLVLYFVDFSVALFMATIRATFSLVVASRKHWNRAVFTVSGSSSSSSSRGAGEKS